MQSLVHAGDQALYAGKELGRDRSVIHNCGIANALADASLRRRAERQGYLSTVLALAEALDVRDWGSTEHSQTVGRLAEMTARELKFDEDHVDRVRIGGILHDIGQIGLPESIRQKPGSLAPDDWQEVKRHPEVGARMLENATVEDISAWIRSHHERPDGTGYPFGLGADEIPLEASIIAVADAYQAMTSDRPYRPALSADAAREQLLAAAGTQFDPVAVEALLRAIDRQDKRSPTR